MTMMQYDRITLGRQAKELEFVRDTLEKVCRLSVDIDLDFSKEVERETMLEE